MSQSDTARCFNHETVKQANLKDLRSKSYQGSEEEWFQIIRFILGQSITGDEPALSSGLEATATVKESEEDGEIIITIRKRVQDITVRYKTTDYSYLFMSSYTSNIPSAKTWSNRPETRR